MQKKAVSNYNKYEPDLKENVEGLYLRDGPTKKCLPNKHNLGQGTITYWLQQQCNKCQINRKTKELLEVKKGLCTNKNNCALSSSFWHTRLSYDARLANPLWFRLSKITVYNYILKLGQRYVVVIITKEVNSHRNS